MVVTVSEELRSIGWEEGQRPFTVHVFIHKMETISNETKICKPLLPQRVPIYDSER